MTDWDDLPPDPLPPVEPHSIGYVARQPDDTFEVTCLDCGSEVIGTACCPAHAIRLICEHAMERGVG